MKGEKREPNKPNNKSPTIQTTETMKETTFKTTPQDQIPGFISIYSTTGKMDKHSYVPIGLQVHSILYHISDSKIEIKSIDGHTGIEKIYYKEYRNQILKKLEEENFSPAF
jgi:hypothetical protein